MPQDGVLTGRRRPGRALAAPLHKCHPKKNVDDFAGLELCLDGL